MRFLWVLLLSCFGLACAFDLPKQDDLGELKQLVRGYLKTNDDAKEWAKWIGKIQERIHDQIDANDSLTEERAADRIVTEYLLSIRKALENDKPEDLKKEDKVLLCRWFLLYHERGWRFDDCVKDYLTKKNFDRWIAAAPEKAAGVSLAKDAQASKK